MRDLVRAERDSRKERLFISFISHPFIFSLMGKGAEANKKRDMKYFSDRWVGEAIYSSLEEKEGFIGDVARRMCQFPACPIQLEEFTAEDCTYFWSCYAAYYKVSKDDMDFLVTQNKGAVKEILWKFGNIGRKSENIERTILKILGNSL